MARMHSKRRGKSGSTHPPAKIAPTWSQYTKEELEEIILQLAKEEKGASQIGLVLRDQYGIPSVKAIMGDSVSGILKKNKLSPEYPEDLMNLMRKAVRLRKHLETNNQDKHNKRVLTLTESKIKRLVSYYKNSKVLPKDWYYKPEQAALIVRE